MADLEGIVQLRGKWIVLERVENPKLARVLHSRLRNDRFAFGHSEGYTQIKTDRKDHVEHHNDDYEDYHNDDHHDSKSYSESGAALPGEHIGSGRNHNEHVDYGYSEKFDRGYSEHTDHY